MVNEELIDTTTHSKTEDNLTQESLQHFVNADFRLGKFQLQLVYNSTDRQGIQMLSSELLINLKKFDQNNSNNPYSFKVCCQNTDFNIHSLGGDKEDVIVEKLNRSSSE